MKIQLATALTLIGMLFAAFLYLNREHLPTGYKYQVESKIIDSDIQRRMEAVHWYEKQQMVRELSPDESGNMDYHRREIDRLRDLKQELDQ